MNAAHTATEGNLDVAPLAGARAGADGALRVLGIITMVAIAVQFALAGLGAFGGSFAAHAALGMAIILFALLIVVAALIARPNRATVLGAVLLVVLAVAQPVFAALGWSVGSWVGAVHAFNGVALAGLTGSLMGGAASRGAARRRG